MKLGILNEFNGHEMFYVQACQELGVEYEIIDIISTNWIENIKKSNCDGFLVRPSFNKQVWKTMFDEKLYYINKIIGKPIYPSYDECFIYENKKNMSYYMQIKDIPHPKTYTFYSKDEANEYLDKLSYPVVFKTNIGSAGLGVKFIENKKQLKKIINLVFTKFRFYNRGYTKYVKKYGLGYPIMDDKQYNFLTIQEKLDVKHEWRIIRLGESYFGHQKLEGKNNMHSGSGNVGWVKPPEQLLNLVKCICDEGNFRSMDVDIFETKDGKYYVNELQTIFGSYDASQMYIDGKPGRFKFINNRWEFEEGYFNQNYSCNLRVQDFVKILQKENK